MFAVAGIAKPERFFTDLTSAGWRVVGTMRFRDHHMFTHRDVRRVAVAARAAGATLIMTTEKDAVRLTGLSLGQLPAAAAPLIATIEPPAAFADWLMDRLRTARSSLHSALSTKHPAPSTEDSAPSTEHSAPSAEHQVSEE
jgi:tetraacyldisaccharide-1-P 4'-kinase